MVEIEPVWAQSEENYEVVEELFAGSDHLGQDSEAEQCRVNTDVLLRVVLDCTHREPLLHIIGDIEELAALVETARDPERLVIEKLHSLPHLDDFVLLKVYPSHKLILALYVEDSLEELDGFFL